MADSVAAGSRSICQHTNDGRALPGPTESLAPRYRGAISLAQLKEEHATGLAHLALPELLKRALPELEAEMRAALAHMPAQRFTGAWAATEAHADFSELGALRGQFVPVSAHELIGC
mgnify:CR=1 FL=1